MERKKAKTLSAAAEVIGANGDLVAEILKRVPAKTLTRWRSVCKAWLLLISSPRFSLLHWQLSLLHWQQQPLSRRIVPYIEKPELVHYTGNNESLEIFPPSSSLDVYIEDSCNGLILLSSPDIHQRTYHVSNPITKKISTLPAPFPANTYSSFLHRYLYLLSDPLKSLHYKVVLLHTKLENDILYFHIHIYSSETNAWWATNSTPPYPHLFEAPSGSLNFRNEVSCNGNIHWLSYNSHSTSLYFDVDHKTFRPMPSPPVKRPSASFRFFGASRGFLHAVDYYYNDVGCNVVVCEMESDYSNWSLKYRFCLGQLILDMEMVVRNDTLRELSFIHGEDEGEDFLVLLMGTNIIYYNIKYKTYNKLQLHYTPEDAFTRFNALPYMETLFPV